ncbi:MAG TPA: GNAT family N-acetyltransferase [Oligoflexus sp.]|uniref:GNAT family N-acetyltransferase n=1 Tax=Oligoflexus sp. TaxID=1971216 RepID=UPI002D5BE89A|nr:GNAT family N-acetyltransferase [Oligoflexus sp.]HYX35157.1 GNAT family N-acetyltransferase [Oligoflexus sp.]
MNEERQRPDWQPILEGNLITARPLEPGDFEALFAVASDPGIWEQHPEWDRYKREVFQRYFQSGIESKGALVIFDRATGELIGCSRYADYDEAQSSVEIGYTFLIRRCWGTGFNKEMKALMLQHAFRFVENVLFYVGENNLRSRKAVEKIGGTLLKKLRQKPRGGPQYDRVVYQIQKSSHK